jgi:MYXO-CTERM domain-containing protein
MPAPDPRPRPAHGLQVDPAGIPEAHDILAAEEFAMPAPEPGSWAKAVGAASAPGRPRWAGLAGAGLLALWMRRRRRPRTDR